MIARPTSRGDVASGTVPTAHVVSSATEGPPSRQGHGRPVSSSRQKRIHSGGVTSGAADAAAREGCVARAGTIATPPSPPPQFLLCYSAYSRSWVCPIPFPPTTPPGSRCHPTTAPAGPSATGAVQAATAIGTEPAARTIVITSGRGTGASRSACARRRAAPPARRRRAATAHDTFDPPADPLHARAVRPPGRAAIASLVPRDRNARHVPVDARRPPGGDPWRPTVDASRPGDHPGRRPSPYATAG